MANEVGRPSDLTDAVFIKIKDAVLEGANLKEISNIIGVAEQTVYEWSSNNYINFSDKVEGWRRDRKVKLASRNIEEMLDMDIKNTGATQKGEFYEFDDTGKLRVKADISKFVLETLDKGNYVKRSELTGKDGKDLVPKPLLGGLTKEENANNDSDNETTETQEEN